MANQRDAHVLLFSLLIACFAVSSFSCGPTKQPKPDDLIGLYRLTSDSLKYLTTKSYKDIPPIAISIEGNGTIGLENMPDCVFDLSGESRGKFVTRTARWKCCETPTFWTLWDGLPFWIDMDDGSGRFGTLILKRRKPPYSSNFLIGDPDSGETLVFEKQPNRV